MLELFKTRGFTAYLMIAFLNAATDIGHKIIIQNTVFKYFDGTTQIVLTAVVNALILLPFVLLFSPSGFLADKYPKDLVIKISAAASIPIALLITWCYYMGWFKTAFVLTLLLSIQAAFYAPAKYGYIKELVGKEQLAPANSYIQSITILAILLSTFVFSVLFESLLDTQFQSIEDILRSIAPAGWCLVAFCTLETVLSLRLERKRNVVREMSFSTKKYVTLSYLRQNLGTLRRTEAIWLSIIGLSIFWGINQAVVAAFPEYLKNTVGVTNTIVATGMLALGGIGVVIGSTIAGKVSRQFIETGIVPLGAVGMTISLFLLPAVTNLWVLGALFFGYGIMGGLFIIPLNALIQFHAGDSELGKILAGNNFMQNVVMLLFLVGIITPGILFTLHIIPFELSSRDIFYALAVIALCGTVYTLSKLPQSFIRHLLSVLLSQKYRLRVEGMKNIPSTGGVLLLGNHTSFLDWAMLQLACPRHIRFVMARQYYNRWYLKKFLDLFGVIPISSAAGKDALQTVRTYLLDGEVVALFPEGRLSRNGHLGPFQKGFELAATGTGAAIIPFYIRGLWGSLYSFATKKYRKNSMRGRVRDIMVSFGTPMPDTSTAADVKQHVQHISIGAWHTYAEQLDPVHISWLQTAKRLKNETSVVNFDGSELSHTKLLTAAIAFARALRKHTAGQKNIGVLLPASSGGVITTLAVMMNGHTVVNLNYTANRESLLHALSAAGITTVISSQQFLQKLEAKGFDLTPLTERVRIVALEDIRVSIAKPTLVLTAVLARVLPVALLRALYFHRPAMSDTAAILFSSGSEGTPKGVELSHLNLIGNIKQVAGILNPQENDVVLSSLPLFHAFGLTASTLMPLVEGLPLVCQPDPTDAIAVGKQVAKYKVTLLFGTSTFLGLYTRNPKVHPLMFRSLRMVVSGAEKLHEQVRTGFREKFGHPIYEGYGTTETTPVAGVNIPDVLSTNDWTVQTGSKPGTVGLPVPGSMFRIVDPTTLEELPVGTEGLILIAGPQLMKGYLNEPDRTASVLVELDGLRWYKTGDKGRLDHDGFLTILDRYSRFAKIGGEMVSLAAVEAAVASALPPSDMEFTAVALPTAGKGEHIVLLVSNTAEDPRTLRKQLIEARISPLLLPSVVVVIDAIPRLGSGKTDFARAKQLALAHTTALEPVVS